MFQLAEDVTDREDSGYDASADGNNITASARVPPLPSQTLIDIDSVIGATTTTGPDVNDTKSPDSINSVFDPLTGAADGAKPSTEEPMKTSTDSLKKETG